jgi:hypothetical protein
MSRFARETLRIMAEIQCEHYPAEALIEMSGVAELDEFKVGPAPQPPQTPDPQAMQAYQQAQQAYQAKVSESQRKLMEAVNLLKSDKMRTFRIDIETDATVAPDQQKEKESRVEFLTAVSPFIEKATMVGMQAPQMVPLLMKMLEFGVRGFRTGRTLEAAIEETIQLSEQMQEQAKNAPPQQPPPDPAAEAQAEKLKLEAQKIQGELAQAQADAAVKQQETIANANDAKIRAQQADRLFNEQLVKVTEEIQFRREETKLRIAELKASIELKTAQMRQANDEAARKEIEGMFPKKEEPTDPNAQHKSALELTQLMTQQKQAMFEMAKTEAALKALMMRDGGESNAIAEAKATPDDILGFNAKPEAKTAAAAAPTKKNVSFVRDETGAISGANIEG